MSEHRGFTLLLCVLSAATAQANAVRVTRQLLKDVSPQHSPTLRCVLRLLVSEGGGRELQWAHDTRACVALFPAVMCHAGVC